jgi:hypothetical protein
MQEVSMLKVHARQGLRFNEWPMHFLAWYNKATDACSADCIIRNAFYKHLKRID